VKAMTTDKNHSADAVDVLAVLTRHVNDLHEGIRYGESINDMDAVVVAVASMIAERDSLRDDAELFRRMETHVAAWHCKEAALPRFVVDPRFADETGEEYSLIVTGSDGVGTVSLRTAILMMRRSKTENARAAIARAPAAGGRK
jgi:hypothetical protein